MKLLLTSAGIKNGSINNALVDLLGKPIDECDALCIPTASYGHPRLGPVAAWQFITGRAPTPMCELGWKSLGVLELTALPSIDEEQWVPMVQEADALLVGGGDALCLCHWMRQSGLADLFPTLRSVYVGISGGSMVMTPSIGEDVVLWEPPDGGDEALGMVDQGGRLRTRAPVWPITVVLKPRFRSHRWMLEHLGSPNSRLLPMTRGWKIVRRGSSDLPTGPFASRLTPRCLGGPTGRVPPGGPPWPMPRRNRSDWPRRPSSSHNRVLGLLGPAMRAERFCAGPPDSPA